MSSAFADLPFPAAAAWPRISVVVCTYNGARWIGDCFGAPSRLDDPDFEVIVVIDGSTDRTATMVREYDFRVIEQENRGLSAARNRGLEAATGEIVAYLDDDAYPDPHWLSYLAEAFRSTADVGMGGPNLAPDGDGPVAECVAAVPGGPSHVLISDSVAEHIPGCNMAFRRAALQAVGGFDPWFRIAGDDEDLCWRLQARGGTLGFCPAAVVWHHRRNSVRAFCRQQANYGRAEGMLARRWPARFNGNAQANWSGRIYGPGRMCGLRSLRSRAFYGVWGSAPFQPLYEPAPSLVAALLLTPEWHLLHLALLLLAGLGFVWRPLFLWGGVLAASASLVVLQAALRAARVELRPRGGGVAYRRLLMAFFHLMQLLARLRGRLAGGLAPWRLRAPAGLALPRRRRFALWSERWEAAPARLAALHTALEEAGSHVAIGGECERCDLKVHGGLFAQNRVVMAIEEHGAGRQRVLFRTGPGVSRVGGALATLFAVQAVAAAVGGGGLAGLLVGLLAAGVVGRIGLECAAANAATAAILRRWGAKEE